MKIKNLLLAGLVLAGLTACSSSDSLLPKEDEVSMYDTYLSINLKSEDVQTRTLGEESQADTDGSSINNVVVYLTKNGKVHFSATANVTGFTSEKIGVPAGSYRLFVVANPNENTPTISTDGDINALISGVTAENADKGFMNGKFLMSTVSNSIDMVANSGSPVTITSANDSNNPVKATAKVDRAAVKIFDKTGENSVKLADDILTIKDDEGNIFFGESIDFKGYVLVNGNKQFNLIQKWKESKTEVKGTHADTPQGSYYTPFTELAKVDDGVITDLTLGKESLFRTGATFAVENCPPFVLNEKLTAGAAQTTGVVYKTVANKGVTFYYVGGVIYTDLEKVNALDEYKGGKLPTTAPELRSKGIKVYENGVMYYTYFIKDQNYKIEYKNEQTFYYNVLRNSVYNLMVNKVKFIGDDVPGGGKVTPENPNPPIDPDQMFLDVTVQINPWILNNIDIEF